MSCECRPDGRWPARDPRAMMAAALLRGGVQTSETSRATVRSICAVCDANHMLFQLRVSLSGLWLPTLEKANPSFHNQDLYGVHNELDRNERQ